MTLIGQKPKKKKNVNVNVSPYDWPVMPVVSSGRRTEYRSDCPAVAASVSRTPG